MNLRPHEGGNTFVRLGAHDSVVKRIDKTEPPRPPSRFELCVGGILRQIVDRAISWLYHHPRGRVPLNLPNLSIPSLRIDTFLFTELAVVRRDAVIRCSLKDGHMLGGLCKLW